MATDQLAERTRERPRRGARPGRKGKNFPATFDAMHEAVLAIGDHWSSMVALNTAQASFKHHGNGLDSMTVERLG